MTRTAFALVPLLAGLALSEKRRPPKPAPDAPAPTLAPVLGVVFPSPPENVAIGIDAAALTAARPRAYASRVNASLWHEELAPGLFVHYQLHEGSLYSILFQKIGAGGE